MANRRFTQFYNTLHSRPVQLDCMFKVDADDAGGYGVTDLKGPGIADVYMFTNATPAAGSPAPAAGYVYVKMQDNYNGLYFTGGSIIAPNSGSDLAVTAVAANLVVGKVYVISALGTTTAAQWVTLGVPIGTTPAVGVAFVAAATGAGAGTGKVQLPSTSGISYLELVGTPNLMLQSSTPIIAGQTSGSYLIFQCLKPAFTGSALATHSHDLKVIGGQAASTTNNIANYATAILGKEEAGDVTYLGADAATNGGVLAKTAGTPAGTIAFAAGAPAKGSIIQLSFVLSNSAIKVQGD
jgi:hypothetical protein